MPFLKAWLAFVFLASIWTAYRFGESIEDLVSHSDPRWDGELSWALPTLLGLAVLNGLGAVVLFFRFKLGFYVIVADAVASVAIILIIGASITSLGLGLVGLVVLSVLVNQNWSALR